MKKLKIIFSNKNCWAMWIPCVSGFNIVLNIVTGCVYGPKTVALFTQAVSGALLATSFFIREHIESKEAEKEISEIGENDSQYPTGGDYGLPHRSWLDEDDSAKGGDYGTFS